jgi:hypothetical protein
MALLFPECGNRFWFTLLTARLQGKMKSFKASMAEISRHGARTAQLSRRLPATLFFP